MSQPLTGQIRPVQRHLSNPEGRLLYLLADLVDRHTGSTPPTTWADVGRHFGWACIWTKEVARSLRRRGLITTHASDGRRFRVSFVLQGVVHNQPQRVVANQPQRMVPNHPLGLVPDPPLDNPPHTPPGGTPLTAFPSAKAKESGGTKDVTGIKGPPSPPLSSEGEKAIRKNGVPTLSPIEIISIDQEINDLRKEIRRIEDRDPDDRTPDQWAKLKEFKARVDLDCERIGRLPIYRKRTS